MVKVPVPTASDAGNRPTVLLVGRGEPMDAALRLALDRHKLLVEESSGDVRTAVLTMAPDLVLLVGDAARDGGRKVLDQLSAEATVAAIPVAVLGAGGKLDSRVAAYRHGAVAVIPRTASADAIATRVALLVREIQERAAAPQPELGEATFDELVDLVSRELRSGILSVQSKDGEPVRLVLGAGRPVAAAVEEFVRRLRPHVARAEPLNYELHVSAGGQVGLLDGEPGPEGNPIALEGLRVLLVDTDPARADALAQELRARKVVVSVADASGRGLERAKGLDPEIVIVDAAGIEGPGFDVLRAIRRDPRLRWASMLVAPWDEIWPDPESIPDVARLAERMTPLVVHDRQLQERAANEAAFDTRLEATGPCRLLRILTASAEAVHVTVRSRTGSVEIDLAEGLVVGAQGNSSGAIVEGISALATLLTMGSARVHVERRPNPTTANLMSPVEEALARATEEAKPLPLSQPPPAPSANAAGVRRRPFPAAAELREATAEQGPGKRARARDPRVEPENSLPPPTSEFATRMSSPTTASKGLSWADDDGGKVPPPRASSKAAFSALFREGAPSHPQDESTALFDSAELLRMAQTTPAEGDITVAEGVPPPDDELPLPTPAVPVVPRPLPAGLLTNTPGNAVRPLSPRRATLAMGGPVLRAPAIPSPIAAVKARGEPVNRNPTLAMGSSPPSQPPPRSETKGSALSAFGPMTKVSRGSSAPPEATPSDTIDTTRDSRDSLEEIIGGATSLAPDPEGSAPLASVSTPPEARSTAMTSAPGGLAHLAASEPPAELSSSELVAPEVEGVAVVEATEDERTVTSGAPFGAPPLPEVPPDRRGQIGTLATIPAGPPAAPLTPPSATTAAYAPLMGDPLASTAPAAPAAQAPPPAPLPIPTSTPQVSSWPVPPAGAVKSEAPPPRPRGARAFAWTLVAAGLAILGAVGLALVWSEVLGRPLPWASTGGAGGTVTDVLADAPLPLDAPAPLVVPGVPDAGVGPDAAVALDVAASMPDAGMDAPDGGMDSPMVVEPGVEPVPGDDPEAAAAALVTRAADATDPVAETLYRQALALDPRNHYAMLGLAEILMRRGDAAGAVPLLEGAVARRRNRAAYRVLLGDARRAAGDAAGARRAWQEALEVDPENRDARARLGE